MRLGKMTACAVLSLAISLLIGTSASAELTTNGDFETGDTTGWISFPTSNSTFGVTADAKSGLWGAQIVNNAETASAVIKQANLGVGLVTPGELITISFDAKGSGTFGGVAFAELFSEIAGGGVSKSELLGGAPLSLDPDNYRPFLFTANLGPNVSGGVTLQLAAVSGATTGSTSTLFLDNVSVRRASAIPEPNAAALLGCLGLGLAWRRRRSQKSIVLA